MLRILAFALSITGLNAFAAPSLDLETVKQLFDKGLIEVESTATPNCHGEGMHCSSSFDCCKGFCEGDICHAIGSGCRAEGARCQNSLDCCKGFCQNLYCHDIGSGCRQEGARCDSSLDCCNSLFCRDGFCH